jgi:pimeloyl-ACP methyl ester carboxylesterase
MNRSELSPLAAWLWQRGVSCLVFDFPCHGRSDRAMCGFGVREKDDVRAAVAYLRARTPGAKVVLVGSSMGAAASALAMGDDPELADALILDSSYSRLWLAVLGWWRFLGGRFLMVLLCPTIVLAAPGAGINPFRVDVAKSLAKLHGKPILILHGEADTLVAAGEAARNFRSAGENARLVWLEGCGHSEGRWVLAEKYLREVERFLELARSTPGPKP